MCLEWQGKFQGQDVAGVTILCRNDQGLIDAIQLFHSPYEQVVAFSAELAAPRGQARPAARADRYGGRPLKRLASPVRLSSSKRW